MSANKIKAILTDIEGTTSSIAFVHQVLFPYAKRELQSYIALHDKDTHVTTILDEVRILMNSPHATLTQVSEQLLHWMEADEKITPLKTLQGLIWVAGYQRGDFKGHIYEDAYQHLVNWHQQNLLIYIFSSGSIQAQKLLFGFSVYGDLTRYISGYFDTTIGGKKESTAYHRIAAAIGLATKQILFLSDVAAELDAAHQAGMQTTWLVRSGELPASNQHPMARNFAEIKVSTTKLPKIQRKMPK